MNNEPQIVIGVDNGYGNTKTSHCCFPTGLLSYNSEPAFKDNLLIYNDKIYTIGTGHKEYVADKSQDEDTYILTLAAIASELAQTKTTSADVIVAAGLPLTWYSSRKQSFKDYLTKNENVDFNFKGIDYNIRILDAHIYPQGFAAVADKLNDFKGVNMLADIGNGTMNVMYISNRKPDPTKLFTEKYGVNQCVIAAKQNMMRNHQATIDDSIIHEVIRYGTANISDDYLLTIQNTAREYTDGIFAKLREHEYDPKLMHLFVVGGGGCLIKNFGSYDKSGTTIIPDISATAKGYEFLAKRDLEKAKDI